VRDISHNLGVRNALSPAVQAATIKGSAIDTAGFNSVAIVVNSGAIVSAGDFTATLQHSDTTTDGDFTNVTAADQTGAFPASLAADASVKAGYVGTKRYVRVVLTKNSGTSIAAGAVAVLGHAADRPVA
jgi:hypothetical protein